MLFRKLWTLDNGYVDGCYYKKSGIFQKRTQVHVRVEDVDAVTVEEPEMSGKKKALLIIGAIVVALLLTPLMLILLAILISVSGGFCRYRFVLMLNGQEDVVVPLNQKEVEKARVFARAIEHERNVRVDGR